MKRDDQWKDAVEKLFDYVDMYLLVPSSYNAKIYSQNHDIDRP